MQQVTFTKAPKIKKNTSIKILSEEFKVAALDTYKFENQQNMNIIGIFSHVQPKNILISKIQS